MPLDVRSIAARSCAIAVAFLACGHALPHPKLAPQPQDLFFEVPYPPPPPHAELVSPRPNKAAVWIDGEWTWVGSRWTWQAGGWAETPPGAVKYAPWELRRTPEGRLIFAPGTWLSARDTPIPPRAPASARECAEAQSEARR